MRTKSNVKAGLNPQPLPPGHVRNPIAANIGSTSVGAGAGK
jgi:hypothetical protein